MTGQSKLAVGVADRALVVQAAAGLLAIFNKAGVLNPADVHTADVVCRIGRDIDERVRLALALTVRALRHGSVCIDLRTVQTTAFDEVEAVIDVATLPWPDPEEWIAACKASPLVADGADQPVERRQVVASVGVLAGDRLRLLGVVPQVGPGHVDFELVEPASGLADPEVCLGLAESAP